MPTVAELQETQDKALYEMRELQGLAHRENRDLTEDENRRFDEQYAIINTVREQHDRAQRLALAERATIGFQPSQPSDNGEISDNRAGPTPHILRACELTERDAPGAIREANWQNEGTLRMGNAADLFRWMGNDPAIGSQMLLDMNALRGHSHHTPRPSYRGRRIDTDMRMREIPSTVASGAAVGETFSSDLERARLAYDSVYDVATVITTERGEPMHFVQMDDTHNKATRIAESGTISGREVPNFTRFTLTTYSYNSDIILIPFQMLQDNIINLESELGSIMGTRIGRALADDFTEGSGTDQPMGIVTAAVNSGHTMRNAGLTYSAVADIYSALGRAWRANARWMFNKTTEAQFIKLVGSNGIPIWLPQNMATGQPGQILGMPYSFNDVMPDYGTAGHKALLFGDMSTYYVRDVAQMHFVRSESRFMELGQVAYTLTTRHAGGLRTPSSSGSVETSPVLYAACVA